MPKRKKPVPDVQQIEPEPKPEPVHEKGKCRVCGKELPDGHWPGRCVGHGTMWPTDNEVVDEHPKLP